MRVLMIDDDLKLIKLLQDYFQTFQIDLKGAGDARSGLALLRAEQPDLVILDVMLPEQDGFSICKSIRNFSEVPIIMLSARGETMDRILGLELGADDYLPKPFEPRELVTRIQAILRRSGPSRGQTILRFDRLEIRLAQREAFLDGEALGLSSMEFDLLALLAGTPTRKFSRDELMNQLQGFESEVYSRSIDVLVSRLRAKLKDDPKQPHFIKSVRGHGYVFLGEKQ
ncbi:response regulator [Oligoflexus tunisiensis]|uniref:response regulator n=1 Tax=Oligoflexus tunisiensis TaxID=708132 RepID=UPI00114CA8FE|nr:response regulator transcription factor [Oligoflexus tunisiensis]